MYQNVKSHSLTICVPSRTRVNVEFSRRFIFISPQVLLLNFFFGQLVFKLLKSKAGNFLFPRRSLPFLKERMSQPANAGTDEQSLKLAVAISLLRSKFLHKLPSFANPSGSDALRWKRKVSPLPLKLVLVSLFGWRESLVTKDNALNFLPF